MIHCHKHKIDYGLGECPMCIKCEAEEMADKAFEKALNESKSVNETLEERAKTHGDFESYAEIYAELIQVVTNKSSLSNSQSAGIDMICSKLARILNGNPNEPDHWHDIAGYATLVERGINNE
jgi:hypothetical protein